MRLKLSYYRRKRGKTPYRESGIFILTVPVGEKRVF